MSRIEIPRGLRALLLTVQGACTAKVKRAQCRKLSVSRTSAIISDNAADAAHPSLDVDVSHPTYMIWGANTGVGKTLVSAGLTASILSGTASKSDNSSRGAGRDVLYVKPVQTGYPEDSDARFVASQVASILTGRRGQGGHEIGVRIRNEFLYASPAVQRAVKNLDVAPSFEDGAVGMKHLGKCDEQTLGGSHIQDTSRLTCKTMWSWLDPISPHLAAEQERATVGDASVLGKLTASLQSFARGNCDREEGHGEFRKWAIIETAGGVASPGPSGTLQCDIYRPLRLPGVLVGDGRLGGISTTVSALESLRVRGYDVEAVVLLDAGLGNDDALLRYLQGRVPVLVLSPVPNDPKKDLVEWFAQAEGLFSQLRCNLEEVHTKRIQRLQEMPSKAKEILWWPFTQHSMVPTTDVTVIDSRCGENFSIHKSTPERPGDALVQQHDGCASWWTQGPDAQLQRLLAREVGYAAGRYGHVMFPENVYEPALHLAELLLEGVGKGWAKRVYYSDNGSTAIEIALKMALRKFVTDRGYIGEINGAFSPVKALPGLKVLALRGSYHGDTLGAMEAQAPTSYTGALQQPWYSGRGSFLDPPTVSMRRGEWMLDCPASFTNSEHFQGLSFQSRDEIFDSERDGTSLGDLYREHIQRHLSAQKDIKSACVGALIVEPVIHGAGGMMIVDPLFQRVLVGECKKENIPVIFDEVFAGCWRLGVQSAAELLHCYPDVACYSKLLTGGVVPLAATLATEEVFDVFQGKSKLDALLHGHSYSAHAVGCAAAVASVKYFRDFRRNSNLLSNGRLQELWNKDLVKEMSCHPSVERVIAIGTVFACEMQTSPGDSGYASTSSQEIIRSLKEVGIYARPLGNVLYLICGPLTPPQTCSKLLETLYHHLPKEVPLKARSEMCN